MFDYDGWVKNRRILDRLNLYENDKLPSVVNYLTDWLIKCRKYAEENKYRPRISLKVIKQELEYDNIVVSNYIFKEIYKNSCVNLPKMYCHKVVLELNDLVYAVYCVCGLNPYIEMGEKHKNFGFDILYFRDCV